MRQLQCEDGSASEPFAVHRERAAQFLRRKGSAMQILSGFDSDGATALEPIKEAGGFVFAQAIPNGQPAGHAAKRRQDRMY